MSLLASVPCITHSTDVFVPQHGSKEKAKKIIILLSDGQMEGDTGHITVDINMLQMDGIVYYAIGVSVHFYIS